MVYEVTRNADGTHTVRRFGAVVRGAVVACPSTEDGKNDLKAPAVRMVQVRLPGMPRAILMPVSPGSTPIGE